MTFLKVSFLMSVITLVKVILTYVMWKIIAVSVGPKGIAIIEQFQNFIQVSRVAIPTGINEGVVKYVSEHKENFEKKSCILSNAFAINIAFFIIALILLVFFCRIISHSVFQSTVHPGMIILVGVGIGLFILNNLGLSILNAEMDAKKYAICAIANTVCNFLTTTGLIIYFGLIGGLIGFALNQTFVGLLTAYLVIKSRWFSIQLFLAKINFVGIKRLLTYSCIPFSASLVEPIALMTINRYLVGMLSWTDAGYWQAITRLSNNYLRLMQMVFGFYFIPKFSSLKTKQALRTEVMKSQYYLSPLILIAVVLVFLLKKKIIVLMYSTSFLPVLPLFKFQILGDFARANTWILKNILVARAMVKECLAMELTFTATYVLFTVIFVHYEGLIGCAMAFAVSYLLYWVTMIIFSILYLKEKPVQVNAYA